MITKKRRKELHSLADETDWHGRGPQIIELLDALDEMERERDAVLGMRIQPMELKAGDVLVVRIPGLIDIIAQSPETAKALFDLIRRRMDLAGMEGIKALVLPSTASASSPPSASASDPRRCRRCYRPVPPSTMVETCDELDAKAAKAERDMWLAIAERDDNQRIIATLTAQLESDPCP